MKIKQEKNDMQLKMLLMEGSTIRRIRKTGENDFYKLWVNDYGHNEGTICWGEPERAPH